MTKPKHYRDGKLTVLSTHVDAIDWALRGNIREGQGMIQAFKAEMERVQAVMDHPDATPALVEKGEVCKAALTQLINVTAEVIHKQQRALYVLERGPV